MYILFEEHPYLNNLVENVLKDIYVLQDMDKKVNVKYVGYFFNPHLNDCVFILPKVLLTEQETLVGMQTPSGEPVTPEMVLEPSGQKALSEKFRSFIYVFSVWIYRTLSVFYKANPDSKAILYKHLPRAGKGSRHKAETYLDIVLSLIAFNRENRDFILFTVKNIHRGNNKINWTNTLGHSSAIIHEDEVVYLNLVNKKRVVNYEEELLIIYFSILNYLNQEYGFNVPVNIQYELIQGKQFKRYLNGYGKTRLRQIKYKFFSDKTLLLWDLCFAFFDNSYQLAINTQAQEYLLAKKFEGVFEAMIDELIGDRNIPKGLKDQSDGKRVDHLYTYDGLTISNDQQDQIYYIGDSKYYKNGHPLTSESIYKQYTYARNVIQWNIDLFVNEKTDNWDNTEDYDEDKNKYSGIKIRDELTEGYNVIPNFFISAFVDPQWKYDDGKNIKSFNKPRISSQFVDRLFDRDTLILSHYNVNFLYIIYLYARNKQHEKSAWKEEVRRIFREEIRDVLDNNYDFYALKSKGNTFAGEAFINEHFKELQGKLFRPYENKNIFSLALEKSKGKDTKQSAAYRLLADYFEILPIKIKSGKNPEKDLDQRVERYQANHPYTPVPNGWLPEYHLERYVNDFFVIGMYHDRDHWDWITGKNDRGSLIYNVRLDKSRLGAIPKSRIRTMKPKFAILYEEGHEAENKYHVFRIHDFAEMNEMRMRQALYPREPKGDYFIFRFDEEITLGKIDIGRFIASQETLPDYIKGMPLFPTGQDLIAFRI